MADHRSRLEAAVDAWNAHDIDRCLACSSPDVALHGFPPQVTDRASLGEFFTGMWKAVPDARAEVHEAFGNGGDRLAARLTMRGTQSGTLMGVPPSNRQFELGLMTFLRFDGQGRTAERWNVADFLTMLQQIGALSAPA